MDDLSKEIERLEAENRYLNECLEIISKLDDNSMDLLTYWRGFFIGKELKSQKACADFLLKYSKDIPERQKKKLMIFEATKCECGHTCPTEFAICGEDGNWTCPNCYIDYLNEQLKDNSG